MRYLSEARKSRKEAGYKAMAKRTGLSTGGAKAEIHKLERKGTIADIKKRSHGAKITNPKAYLYGTEAKILKQHAKKIGR